MQLACDALLHSWTIFFFQAEDGIRDDLVTGVQTCALPICGTRLESKPEIGTYTGLFSNLVPLTTLFLLLRAKRAAVYDGRLSLGSGIGSGVLTSFIAALLVYSFLVTYSHFINPTWIDQVLEAKVAQQRAAHV